MITQEQKNNFDVINTHSSKKKTPIHEQKLSKNHDFKGEGSTILVGHKG